MLHEIGNNEPTQMGSANLNDRSQKASADHQHLSWVLPKFELYARIR